MELIEIEKRIREADCQALMDYKSGKGPAPELYKPFGYMKVAEDGKPMVFVASEESEDRIGDVITAAGWELEEFRKNPVYMFAHDYRNAPIGIVPKVWIDGKQLMNLVEWDTEDELARFIQGKYQRKVMRAESVGFRPIDWEEGEKGFLFKSQELLEISAVPVPMHPHALAKAMHNGKFTIIIPERIKEEAPPPKAEKVEKPEMMAMAQECKDHLQAGMDVLDQMMAGESDEEGKTIDVKSVMAAIKELRAIGG